MTDKTSRDRTDNLDTGAATRRRAPLITAIEIENFKGIDAPVRVDLRPITLLFGRNSAGKSTILQALCYAHEILSHGNVDAHKTELGGEQIDLGGFRQFVHGHDLDRVVRLQLDLNLEDWQVPAPVRDRMNSPRGLERQAERDSAHEFEEWIEAHNPANVAQSGWVELRVKWHRSRGMPVIASYEVAINEELVGRIQESGDPARMELAFNWAHPLFDALRERENETTLAHAVAAQVREAPDSRAAAWRLYRVAVRGGLKSPLPDWDDLLHLDDDDLEYNDDVDIGGLGSTSYPRFQALVTGVLAGVGRSLRDDLERLRYLGPVRKLHPRTAAEPGPHDQGSWSDGSAAWQRLVHHDHYADWPDPPDEDLLKKVNEWLGAEHLDTGYRLQRRSTVQLPADAPAVSQIRQHEAKGHPPSTVKALVRAIATADVRTTLQLVTVGSELPVRTSDIGVGVSQILPVVTAALDPQRPGLTAIEQPELHVHPRMQVELGDLFAQRVDQGGIFLIETHSEHLLLRIMRRMRQTTDETSPAGAPRLRPADVAVFLVEPDGAGTLVREMPLNERGDLVDAWPGGFFEEDLREIFDVPEPS